LIVVIGSGPAGVSAARALLDRGLEVTLLDAGIEMEPERREIARQLAARPPDQWEESLLAEARREAPMELGGVPLKYTFGSAFPYRDVERLLPFESRGCATRPTLARGGFSSVWGATVLPHLAEDLADWPVSAGDLAPHYRAVTAWMPLAAVRDDLAEELPLHADSPRPLEPSPQARALLGDLERRRDRLRRGGLRFGRSRLAVRAEAAAGGPACAYCQMCLHGCPWGLIYEAGTTLEDLRRQGLHYVSGVVVDRLVEAPGEVAILGRSLATEEPLRFAAERVYVACGALGSTRLLLRSLEAFDQPVEMKDSQYFLLPLLRLHGSGAPRQQAMYTLSQVFLELRDPSVCPRNVHLQVYGYNHLYAALFERLLGGLERIVRPAIDALLSRLLVIQGYLHSDASASMRVWLERGEKVDRLVLEAQRNPLTRPTLRRVVRRLVRHAPDLRAAPVAPLLRVAPAGRGFHSGGTFPMRAAASAFESDVLGRPHGFSRVHVVDATVFPTIPSTTITFTVMANAHRIASLDV
jgi:choline dehydrogenase-like flavoprotein